MKWLERYFTSIEEGTAGAFASSFHWSFTIFSAIIPFYTVASRYITPEEFAAALSLVFALWFCNKFAIAGAISQFVFWLWGGLLILSKQSYTGWLAITYFSLLSLNGLKLILAKKAFSNSKKPVQSPKEAGPTRPVLRGSNRNTDDTDEQMQRKLEIIHGPIKRLLLVADTYAKPFEIKNMVMPVVLQNLIECHQEVIDFDDEKDLENLGYTILYASVSQILNYFSVTETESENQNTIKTVLIFVFDSCLEQLNKAGIFTLLDVEEERMRMYEAVHYSPAPFKR